MCLLFIIQKEVILLNELFPAEQTAAAYIRVSTARQDEYSPDSQLKLIRDYAQKNGLIVPDEFIFFDDGISGSKAEKRPEFIKMIGLAKDNSSPFKTILVWKFSRFARNQEESIVYKKMLKKNGIQVISISEPITEDPFGSLIERIIEWMDEYYLIRLSPEVKRGMLEKFNRGEPVANAPIGYKYDEVNKKFVIDPQEAEIIKLIFSKFNEGIGMQRIARLINQSGYRTVKGNLFDQRNINYILHNPCYIGSLRWSPDGKKASERVYDPDSFIIIPNTHDAIISEEEFQKAQTKLAVLKKREPSARSGTPAEYMLKGLVKCSNCGANLTKATHQGMQCWKYTHAKCDVSHYVQMNIINNEVITAIQSYILNDALDINIKPKPKTKTIDYDKQINDLNSKKSRLTQAYLDEVISIEEFKSLRTNIENQIAEIEADQKKETEEIDINSFRNALITVSNVLNSDVSESIKNEALRTIVESIIFNRTANTITINFFY